MDRRCKADAKATGKRCRKAPVRGSLVCWKHGAAAGQVKRAAQRRVIEHQAATQLVKLGLPEVDDPIVELGKLAAESRGLATALAHRVNALTDLDSDGMVAPALSAYERASSRLARMLADLGRLGYEARRVQISEAIADQVADVVNGILADLRLDAEQESRAPAVVARHMMRLAEAA